MSPNKSCCKSLSQVHREISEVHKWLYCEYSFYRNGKIVILVILEHSDSNSITTVLQKLEAKYNQYMGVTFVFMLVLLFII